MKFANHKRFLIGALAAACVLAGSFFAAGAAGEPAALLQQAPASVSATASSESFDAESAETDSGDGAGISSTAETTHDASGAECESDTVLVSLAEGMDVDAALGVLAEETRIAGISAEQGDASLVELSIPDEIPIDEAVSRIGASSAVDTAQPNYIYHLVDSADEAADGAAIAKAAASALTLAAQAAGANDPLIGDQWALQSIYAYGDTSGTGNAWDLATTDRAVTVAVIDEGFQANHPDLKDNVVAAYNAADGSDSVSEVSGEDGHGTHVAGIVGAVANNAAGVAGVSYNARLMLIKVTEKGGGFSSATLAKAIDYAVSNRAKYNIRVINMSIGGGVSSSATWGDDVLIKAIDRASAAGIVVVCSAGNAYTDGAGNTWTVPYLDYPADYKNVVSVINLKHTGSDVHAVSRNSDSNYNFPATTAGGMPTGKNISAPGTDIYSTMPSSRYEEKTGTSMAAPCVSGVLALVFAAHPELTASEAISLLYSTATDVTASGTGWDRATGYGEVNAYRAVAEEGYLSGTPSVQAGKSTVLSPSEAGAWTWQTSDAGVATVSNGTVIGVAAGVARISATRTVGGTAQTLQQIMVVYDPKIVGSSSVAPGGSAALTIGGSPAGGWTWTSSDVSVATVNGNGVVKGKSFGSTTIKAVLADNPAISVSKKVTVKKLSIAKAAVEVGPVLYTGKARKPAPVVMLGSTLLKRGTDYTLTYKNNVEVGTATVVITGKGGYKGTAKATFKIVRKPSCSGATRVPVGATATYKVKNGSIKIASGSSYAKLSGRKLVARKAGTVVLSIRDAAGVERATKKVKVYALSGEWELRSGLGRSYALGVEGASKANGANVQIQRAKGTAAQQFRFKLQPDGTFRVVCVASGKTIEVAGASKVNRANVRQRTWKGTASQRWRMTVDKSNRITLVNRNSGRVLRVAANKASNGCNVYQYASRSAKAQKWYLVKAE